MRASVRRVFRRIHRDMAGVSLVEMLVAIGVFMLFSSMFVVSIVQFVRSNAMDGVRSQSASQISTAMQRIGTDATDAAGVWVTHDSSGNSTVVMYIPKEATGTSSAVTTDSTGRCVALTEVKNSSVIVYRSKTAESSSKYASSGQTILTSLISSSVFGPELEPSVYADSFTFSPEVGTTMYGLTVSSQASKTFYARNYVAGDWTSVCPVPASPTL